METESKKLVNLQKYKNVSSLFFIILNANLGAFNCGW